MIQAPVTLVLMALAPWPVATIGLDRLQLAILRCGLVGALLHDYVLGPRLQRELGASHPSAPSTRRRLVLVGWFNFALTLAVPILGAVVLTTLD